MAEATRIERDSLGEVEVPVDALYGAQTQRAVQNFAISDRRLPREMIRALGLIKEACAQVNGAGGELEAEVALAIAAAAREVAAGDHDDQFPIDLFQTGSGTSSNMNANEVIASLASRRCGLAIHPNDQVNRAQSSNDVFPSAIRLAALLLLDEELHPALDHLIDVIEARASELDDVVKTGRTHLMDAMPIRLSQELRGWSGQLRLGRDALRSTAPRLAALPIGGTAVGTGVNAPEGFGGRVAEVLSSLTGQDLRAMSHPFTGIAGQDGPMELSGQLRSLATALLKISNDLRWMNSGPLAGLGEIVLPALQPGSSIMPGKVNPVIPEAVAMVCAQVMGNDLTVAVAAGSGSFQLNVMLPVLAANLLESERLLSRAMVALADRAIAGFRVNRDHLEAALGRNPILVTALNPLIGYERGARIAKRAYAEARPLLDVAREEVPEVDEEELRRLLDPARMT